ncbi:DUF7287 family protein [Natronorarus salvus]|uniref:DUF7287 family protein n=1 Tax=Natronorarus salvus TaxID=3117733 RepID=UPI002F26BB00
MNARGQTGIDFLVGATVFLIAVGFVFAFVPSMFAPFFTGGTGDTLTADRAATQLAEKELVVDPSSPAVLNESSVDEFFEGCTDEEDEGQYVADELGLGTDRVQVELGNDSCGDDPPARSSVTVSQRYVSIDEDHHTLTVRVWS